MNVRLWPYFLRQAVANMVHNRMVHAVALSSMIVSMLILGAFLLLFVNLNSWLQGWGHALSISVYLKDTVTVVEKDRIAKAIKAFPHAEIQRFISKEKAMRELNRALGSQRRLLRGLSHNPLPASFEVVFRKGGGQMPDPGAIKERLEEMEGVQEVQYSEEWLQRFEGVMHLVRLVGFVIAGLLCLGVLFIVTNTIKLAIYSRKEEIEIMKLVGATDWFVKIPFLIEGVIQGILTGVLSLSILFSGYLLLSEKKIQLLSLAVLHFGYLPRQYSLLILLLSLALGLIGSLIALGRFFDI